MSLEFPIIDPERKAPLLGSTTFLWSSLKVPMGRSRINSVDFTISWKRKREMIWGNRSGRYGDLIRTPMVQLKTAENAITETTIRLCFLLNIRPLEAVMVASFPGSNSALNSRRFPFAKRIRNTIDPISPPIKAAKRLSKAKPERMVATQISEKFKRIICLLRVRTSLFLKRVFTAFSPSFESLK